MKTPKTFEEYRLMYWAIPAKYSTCKYGDMPTTYDIYDAVDAYLLARARVVGSEV